MFKRRIVRYRRRLASLALVACCGASALSSPAYALDDTMAELKCEIAPGVVGALVPGAEGRLNDLTLGNGWDALRLMDTDNGTFVIDGDVVCTGEDPAANTTENNLPSAFAATYNFQASGAYSHLICGTLTLTGALTVAGPGTLINAHMGSKLEDWQGRLALVIKQGGQITGPIDAVGNQVDGGMGIGTLQLVPEQNCELEDVHTFQLSGSFQASLSDHGGGYM